MPQITQIGRVMVPVADQDQGIAFYTSKLGFSVVADVPFGDNDRWVEVAPSGGGTAVSLVPPQGEFQPGRMTGIALVSPDPRAAHATGCRRRRGAVTATCRCCSSSVTTTAITS